MVASGDSGSSIWRGVHSPAPLMATSKRLDKIAFAERPRPQRTHSYSEIQHTDLSLDQRLTSAIRVVLSKRQSATFSVQKRFQLISLRSIEYSRM